MLVVVVDCVDIVVWIVPVDNLVVPVNGEIVVEIDVVLIVVVTELLVVVVIKTVVVLVVVNVGVVEIVVVDVVVVALKFNFYLKLFKNSKLIKNAYSIPS